MEKLDYFGCAIQIRFKGFKTHKTKCGMLFTLCLFAIIVIRISSLFIDFSQGKNPIVLFQERLTMNPKRFDINIDSFNLAFGIVANDYSYYDQTIFQIESYIEIKTLLFNQTTQSYDQNWTQKQFKMEKCTKNHIINNTEFLNQFISLDSHYCFPKDMPLHIEGEYNQDDFAQIIIQIKRCQGPQCQNDQDIDKAMKLFFGEVIFTDVYVSPEIKDVPYTKYVRDIFWEISNTFPKTIYMEMRNNYVETDSGLFVSNARTDIYPSFSKLSETVTNPRDDVYSTFILRFEKKKENLYKRSYKNILPIISELGGLLSVLTTVGLFITYYYTQTHLNQELINNTFTFQEQKKQEKEDSNLKKSQFSYTGNRFFSKSINKKQNALDQIIDNNSSPKRAKQISNNQILPPINLSSLNLEKKLIKQQEEKPERIYRFNSENQTQLSPTKQAICSFLQQKKDQSGNIIESKINSTVESPNLKESIKNQKPSNKHIEEMINQNNNSMKFNILDYFMSFFVKSKESKRRKAIYDYSIQQLYDHLDIQWIINKLIEFDKLKRVLLDDDQLLLFEYLPKPSIGYSFNNDSVEFHDNQTFTMLKKSKNEIENIQRAIQSYKRIINKLHIKQIDNRLLNYMDSSYKDMFLDELKLQKKQEQLFQQQCSYQIKKQPQNSLSNEQEEEMQQDYLAYNDQEQINVEDTLKQYSSIYKAFPCQSQFPSQIRLSNNNSIYQEKVTVNV